MSNKMKILVVDDEKIVVDSCRRVLAAEGFEVLFTNSADGALKILETETPVLLLVDVKMPGRDGISLMAELKETRPEIPIVVMSGYPTMETISEAAKKGAARFISKPFTPDELLDTVRRVMPEKETV